MFCTKCGTQVPDGARFCVACGTRFEFAGASLAGKDGVSPEGAPTQPRPTSDKAPSAPAASGTQGSAPQAASKPQAPASPASAPQAPQAAPSSPREGGRPAASTPRTSAPTVSAVSDAGTSAPPPQVSRSRLPLVIGIATVLALAVVVFFVVRGIGAGKGVTGEPASIEVGELDPSVKAAIEDAAALAREMGTRYEGYFASAEQAASGAAGESESSATGQGTPTGDATTRVAAESKRLAQDRDALSQASDFTGRAQALAALDNLSEILVYEQDVFDMQHKISSSLTAGSQANMLVVVEGLYEGYQSLRAPAFLKAYSDHTVAKLPTIYRALVEILGNPSSTLSQYTSTELLQWWLSKQTSYDKESNRSVISQCGASAELLDSIVSGAMSAGAPAVEIDAIARIAPNLYPSLDAAAIIDITAYDSGRQVSVSAEVVGFTQPVEEQYTLAQGYNRIPIKPATLPASQMGDLSSNTDTQLNIKVTDVKSGAVLAQRSQPVELLSIYDFVWSDDEFGATAAFDILAWLRPQCDEVAQVNRAAADILSSWTNGQETSIVGYQYGDDWSGTLMQVAAIQKAMSDAGVVYIMDNYSFTSEQHVLTPDQVIKKRQGLCIESSLLMASCLLSAGMHPMIILIPGHAQIAIETYAGSGNYFLIETTTLPYDGVNTTYAYDNPAFWNGLLASSKTSDGSVHTWTLNGSSDEWKQYLDYVSDGSDEYGGVFVIDCQLQKTMGIQGLEAH